MAKAKVKPTDPGVTCGPERLIEKHKGAHRYVKRGIIVEDPRWKNFEAFLADMGERPVGRTLHRINNNLGLPASELQMGDSTLNKAGILARRS